MWEIFNLFFMVTFLRVILELGSSPVKATSNPTITKPISFSDISVGVKENPKINPELLKMFPPERIEKIKKKELRKYKTAQDKKWRKWLEAVSE